MISRRLLIFLIVVFIFIKGLLAYDIKKIGLEDGLSNNNVVSFAQDKIGYIWICTKDGLNRYDGFKFKIFRHKKNDTNTICSNVLNYIYEDKFDDIIWIASEKNGLDAYYYKLNKFKHYIHDGNNPNSLIANGITHITADNIGNLWIATYLGGIEYFDKKTEKFIHYNTSNVKGLVSNYNWYILYDSDERLYIGHVTDGLSILNPKTRTAVNFKHNLNDPNSLPDNTVTCIFKDSRSNIWIGTRNGLCVFDPVTAKMVTFKNDPKNNTSLVNNFIQSIVEDANSYLWIGTEGGGICLIKLDQITSIANLDPKDVKFIRIPVSDTPDGLSSSSVQEIFIDSYGNKWIGGLGGGVNFIPANEPFFKNITYLPIYSNLNSLNWKVVSGICVDNDNNVWVANVSGGICVYKDNKKIKEFKTLNKKEISQNFTYVYKDKESNIWISTDDGRLYMYDIKKKVFISYENFPEISNIPIYNIFEDSKNNLWLSTDIGLLMFNPKSGIKKFFTTKNSKIRDDNIRVVNEDIHGNIWVGTLGGGLGVFDENFDLLYEFGNYFDFYSIKDIYRDLKGRMWIASQNDLFMFKDYKIENVIRIGEKYGLIENDIRAIIEGKNTDEIWFSTTNCICHLDVKKMQIRIFNVNDGIVRGDYIHNSKAKLPDGTIYFGSQNGVTYFNQDLQNYGFNYSGTFISAFQVADNKKGLNEMIDIPFKDTMVLTYLQNTFQIFFNVLDFSLSDKVEFAFKMEGLDDSWYFIGQDKYVIFRNLKPGHYIFNLKTRLHNSDWSDKIVKMYIKIKPPFWLAWWAKLIYILLLIIILLYFIKFYKNKIKIEHELIFEKKSREQEHKLNEERMKFFTNITHELRTPMTLILGPLEELIVDKNIPQEQLKKLNSIHNVATRLYQLINQILEFRKVSNKIRKLKVVKGDFGNFIYEIGLKYCDLAKKKNIDYKIDIPSQKIEMFYDPEVVSIIVDNLLSNAFKYTPEGKIILKVQVINENNIEYTVVKVSDTGYGISEEDLPHIFERYYQGKNTPYPVSGTGIGLAIVESMVELHEAEISVCSEVNKGSTFAVRFITKNSYPEAIHIDSIDSIVINEEEQKKSILIVDDNPEIIDYIKDCLSDSYLIYSAQNGKTGFEVACEKMPDLVIADIMMPIMDGIEMTRTMKKDIRTSHIPVVLLTAKGSFQDQKEGYEAGADAYLTKPFSGNLLKSMINNILETRDKLRAAYSSKFKEKQEMFIESINKLDKEFLQKLDQVIEKYIEDEELHISQIAKEMNMSHSTLYRKIKALTNLTANEYIRKVRIKTAEKLLLTGKYTISEIMYRVGINSSSYFRQCFKEEFGMNPSEYLQKLKNHS